MSRLAIIGAGSWGTALALVLAPKFDTVRLWVHRNPVLFPGFVLQENVILVTTFEVALRDVDIVLSVIPSHVVREVYSCMCKLIKPNMQIVTATKGLEMGSFFRVSEVVGSVLRGHPVTVLSGPTFAQEVAGGKPTALVAASTDLECASRIQTAFSGPTFRVYASDDPIGVEIGGALKNVIAIGAGICDGLGLGHNAVAALITRGLAELTRLAVALGGKAETLAGLAGLGDLVLTCTGNLSRNRTVGLKLAAGMPLTEILESTSMVAEGVRTTSVAIELARRVGVELPIVSQMHAVLNLGRSPNEAIQTLMSRTLRPERE